MSPPRPRERRADLSSSGGFGVSPSQPGSEVGDAERDHLREVMMVAHGQAFDEGRRHPPGEEPPVWPPEAWGVH